MPELPEVETLRRRLAVLVTGLIPSAVYAVHPELIQSKPWQGVEALKGQKITGLERRGKYLSLQTGNGDRLWFHLGMTGQLLWKETADLRDPHLHFYLEFEGISHKLCFRDIRKFGKILFVGAGQALPESLQRLGPEPFEIAKEKFIFLLRAKTGKIKGVLLDQHVIAGVGNIYADESLFRAGIHPKATPARLNPSRIGQLLDSIQAVFTEAIESGGSSIDDYRLPDGSRGEFQKRHRVYGKRERPCAVCGNLIKMIVLAGRSSFFCAQCQKY